jgi:hypothetical protein
MLDDQTDVTDDEVRDFWWAKLTDEERSAWMIVAQSVNAADAWSAYRKRMSEA